MSETAAPLYQIGIFVALPIVNVQSKGIAAGLQNIQKLEDGEMLAGGSTAEEDFGGDNEWSDDDMM